MATQPHPIFLLINMKIQLIRIIAAVILLTISFPLTTEARRVKAKDAITDSVMQRIFCYAQKIDTTGRGSHSSYAYTKFQMFGVM